MGINVAIQEDAEEFLLKILDTIDNSEADGKTKILYFAPELLEGDNRYKAGPHGLQNAVKTLRIAKLPDTLVIHLKRFAYHVESGELEK
eukprot:gene37016-45662_t